MPEVDTSELRAMAEMERLAGAPDFAAAIEAAADTIDALRKRVAELEPKWVEGKVPRQRGMYIDCWIVWHGAVIRTTEADEAAIVNATHYLPIVRPTPPEGI